MALEISAMVLVIAIALFHSRFGLYSGVINVFCSITAACLAFGFWRPLTELLVGFEGLTDHARYLDGVTLVAVFILTLSILRSVADKYIRGNVHVPPLADTIGGGLCGFVNAQLAIGILVIGMMLLPFGGRAGLYSRFERSETETRPDGTAVFERNAIMLVSPDDFTLGLVSFVSGGSLQGPANFNRVYPNFADWVYSTGNTISWESETTYAVKARDGAIKVDSWWYPEQVGQVILASLRADPPTEENPNPPFQPAQAYQLDEDGKQLLGVRLTATPAVADGKGGGTMRFRPTMLRLVGQLGGEDGEIAEYYPRIVGGADSRLGGSNRIVDWDTNFSLRLDGETPLNLYYVVPEEGFDPWFIEFGRYVRAEVEDGTLAEAPADEILLTPTDGAAIAGAQSARRPRRAPGAPQPYNLPLPVARSSVSQLEGTGTRMRAGRIAADVAALQAGAQEIATFERQQRGDLVHVRYQPRRRGSTLGRTLDLASRTDSYFVRDALGARYRMVGWYTTVNRGSGPFIELFYAPPGTTLSNTYNGSINPQSLQWREIEQVGVTMLFLIPQGRDPAALVNQQGKEVDRGAWDVTIR